ncbi:Hypothetical predicted protein, partial [Mytilus galloprovincialis]
GLFAMIRDNCASRMESLLGTFGKVSRAISKISWMIALRESGEPSLREKKRE